MSHVVWSLRIPWTNRTGRTTWMLKDAQSTEVQDGVFVFPVSMSIRRVFTAGTSAAPDGLAEESPVAKGSAGKLIQLLWIVKVLRAQLPRAPVRNSAGTR